MVEITSLKVQNQRFKAIRKNEKRQKTEAHKTKQWAVNVNACSILEHDTFVIDGVYVKRKHFKTQWAIQFSLHSLTRLNLTFLSLSLLITMS